MKRILSCFLSVIMVFSILSIPAQAETAWDPNAGGGGDTGNVAGGTFQTEYTGFRVTLFNGNELFYPDTSCIDILFTEPTWKNVLDMPRTNKLGNAEAIVVDGTIGRYGTIDILKDMPTPIGWDNASQSFVANGEAIREYLMKGKIPEGGYADGPGGNPFGPRPVNPTTPTTPTDPTTPTTPVEPEKNENGLTEYQQKLCDKILDLYYSKISNYVVPEMNIMASAISYHKGGYYGPVVVIVPTPKQFSAKLDEFMLGAQDLTSGSPRLNRWI